MISHASHMLMKVAILTPSRKYLAEVPLQNQCMMESK